MRKTYTCTQCGEKKLKQQFSMHSTGSRRTKCKACRNYNARLLRINPVVVKKNQLINWPLITGTFSIDDWEALWR